MRVAVSSIRQRVDGRRIGDAVWGLSVVAMASLLYRMAVQGVSTGVPVALDVTTPRAAGAKCQGRPVRGTS